MIRVFFGVSESYGNPPGEVVGLNGSYEKGEKGLKGCPLPPYIKEQGGGSRPRGGARQSGEYYSHRE